MGKLKGIIPIEGSVGNITFAKTPDGIIVKEKTGISAARIATDPAFARTRENNAEFRTAANAGKLFRMAFQSAIINAKDRSHSNRLVKRLMKVLKTDSTNVRGERTVVNGSIGLLEQFEFNEKAPLTSTLFAKPVIDYDRSTGELSASIANLNAANSIEIPEGATHVKIVLAAALVNFESLHFDTGAVSSAQLAFSSTSTTNLNLQLTLPPASAQPLFVAIGLEYFQLVNSVFYPLKNGTSNAMAVVTVDV